MPSKINASKRKSDAPPSRENLSKAARTHISRNAATSIRQGLCLTTLSYFISESCFLIVSDNEHMTNKGGEKGKYFHPYCKIEQVTQATIQRMLENQLGEQFGPIVVEVDMLTN